jgi:hypothetical protein
LATAVLTATSQTVRAGWAIELTPPGLSVVLGLKANQTTGIIDVPDTPSVGRYAVEDAEGQVKGQGSVIVL